MHLGTIAPQKYFNGVATETEKADFTQKVIANFSTVGTLAFGQMKFIVNEQQDAYNWTALDNFITFTKKYGLKAQYNTVINNKDSFPDWFLKLTEKERVLALEKHIKTVVKRYGEDFQVYKLVNEVVRNEEANFFGTGMQKAELIANMFTWAKETNPNVQLMLNDFAIFVREDIRKMYIDLIIKVLGLGGPIDVVGFQGHLGYPSPYSTPVFQLPPDSMLITALDEVYSETGLPIYVTEFDLSYTNNPLNPYTGSEIDPHNAFTDLNGKRYNSWFDYQAYAYKHFYEICASKSFVTSLTFWDFYEKDTLPNERPGAGFFDKAGNEKPVYKNMKTILKSNLSK